MLKFSTEIEIFIKHLKKLNLILHFSIGSPVQCYPEKANFMQNFCSWYLMGVFSEWYTTCALLGNLSQKTPVLVGLISK